MFFQGRELDPATGLYDFRNRWYSAELGRFLTRDPSGYPDGPNQYAGFLANPTLFRDPSGLAVGDWWDPRNLDGEFWGSTGYSLWNAASLGTLDAVTERNGLASASGSAADHLANVGTFGLQNNLIAAAEADGDLSGGDVGMAVSRTAYDLTPMEEARLLIQEGDQLDAAETTRLVFTGISKTAGLGALAVGASQGITGALGNRAPAATTSAVNPALQARLAHFKAWKARAGIEGTPTMSQFRRFVGAHRPGSRGATLYEAAASKPVPGRPGSFGNWYRRAVSPHGNSSLSSQLAHLYKLVGIDGGLLKWGITQSLARRYTSGYLWNKRLIRVNSGPRSQMLAEERALVETQPGPLNLEPWAGAQR